MQIRANNSAGDMGGGGGACIQGDKASKTIHKHFAKAYCAAHPYYELGD